MIDLSALERLAAEATPGPWQWDGVSINGANYAEVVAVKDVPPHAYPELQHGKLVITEGDADFIAACDPATVAALVRAVKAAVLWVETTPHLGDADALDALRPALAAFRSGRGDNA